MGKNLLQIYCFFSSICLFSKQSKYLPSQFYVFKDAILLIMYYSIDLVFETKSSSCHIHAHQNHEFCALN